MLGGTIVLSNSRFVECTAPKGGASYVVGGRLNLTNGTIEHCEATSFAGGILCDGGLLLGKYMLEKNLANLVCASSKWLLGGFLETLKSSLKTTE